MSRGRGVGDDGDVFMYEPASDAAYISISDRQVVRSRELHPNVIVDLDANGQVIGVEIIGLYRLMGQVAPEAQP